MPKNSICGIRNCSYVGCMSFLPVLIVLSVAVFFVWRSSGQKKHGHDCGCGCDHGHDTKAKEPTPH